MTVEIIDVNEDTAAAVFDGGVKLADVLDYIAAEARAFDADAETAIGRKEIAAMAYKVTRSKTLIDSVGKNIVDVWKKQAKVVDAQRKEARDFLDALRDEVRKPVTDWENEQQRIKDEAAQKEAEEQAARLAEIDRREAELKDKEEAIAAAERAEREAKERADREAQIAKEAAERATREAEQKAEREKHESIQREQAAIAAKEKAERDAKEAADAAAYRADQARLKAEQDVKDAVERARAMAQAEKEAEQSAQMARDADKKHKATVNNSALADFVRAGLTEDMAKKAVVAIARGTISHVAIRY